MSTLAQQSTVQVRIDEVTKRAASDLFDKLGLDMSTAIKMFLKKAVDVSAIPFIPALTVNGFTPEYEDTLLSEGKETMKNGKSYANSTEMFKDILGKEYNNYAQD